jgi:ABC-type phosphate/phosphonate transport system substrate-binding protein
MTNPPLPSRPLTRRVREIRQPARQAGPRSRLPAYGAPPRAVPGGVHRPKGSPIQSLAQLAGRKLLMPDEYAATTAVAKAELRRQSIAAPYISHTRFQDSVATQVSTGMAEAGVVNPTMWKEAGGIVIGETQPVVNWSVLASPKAPPDLVARLTESLLAMNRQSPAILADIGVKQWQKADRKDYLAVLDYTGE